MVEVSTSLLSAKKDQIIKTIYDIEVAGTDYIHIDVMDGKFVKQDTTEFMRECAECAKNVTNLPLDVHLMVKDVENYIKSYLAIEPHSIIFHLEACKNKKEIMQYITLIRESGVKIGISISPKTPIENVYEYLPYVHKVLIMTVEPGKGGQKFITDTLDKISKLNIFAYENNYDIDIEADGGINNKTCESVKNAGANILVAGTYILKSESYKKAISNLK